MQGSRQISRYLGMSGASSASTIECSPAIRERSRNCSPYATPKTRDRSPCYCRSGPFVAGISGECSDQGEADSRSSSPRGMVIRTEARNSGGGACTFCEVMESVEWRSLGVCCAWRPWTWMRSLRRPGHSGRVVANGKPSMCQDAISHAHKAIREQLHCAWELGLVWPSACS